MLPRWSMTADSCWQPGRHGRRGRLPRGGCGGGAHRDVAASGARPAVSYGIGLVRHLRAEGLEVLEVNQPHAHTRRRRGKSDPIDAEMAARDVLAASSVVIAKDTTGIVAAQSTETTHAEVRVKYSHAITSVERLAPNC